MTAPCSRPSGVNVHVVFAIVFAIGAGLAGFAGVVGGSALSVAPGEDVRYLLASLVVVIVGGMGSITGAAIGALADRPRRAARPRLLADLRRRLTFVIMVVTLAFRPQGIMGRARPASAPPSLSSTGANTALAVPSEFGALADRACRGASALSAGRHPTSSSPRSAPIR